MKKTIGVIVDGEGDFAAFERRLGRMFRILKADGPRGHTVPAQALVHSSKKQVAMLGALGCRLAILITDFEQRREPYTAFLTSLRNRINISAFPIETKVIVPNRMFENWLLADVEELSRKKTYIKDNLKQKNYEGRDGKRELKMLISKGHSYNEVKHGADLFTCIRFEVAIHNSSSFREFHECLKS